MTGANHTHDPSAPHGVLPIDKPLGITSASVVAVVKGRLKAAGAPKRVKVGHAGTLDPLATGLLIVLVGKATKLQSSFMAGTKTYRATVDLASFSSTDDAEGQKTPVAIADAPTQDAIKAALSEHFTGTIDQLPPDHSAVKIGGRRAYDLARAGKPVPIEPRPVTIHSISIESYRFPELILSITCGKGTYIRSIARDLGKHVGTGGHLLALRRTQSSQFTTIPEFPTSPMSATPLDDLEDPINPDRLIITPELEALLAQSTSASPSEPSER